MQRRRSSKSLFLASKLLVIEACVGKLLNLYMAEDRAPD
jgi:hypothetical protein